MTKAAAELYGARMQRVLDHVDATSMPISAWTR